MGDQELRELERAWRETQSPEDKTRWLQAQARATGLAPEVLETRQALAERGLAWAQARWDELMRPPGFEAYGSQNAALEAVIREAFGPLAPSLNEVMQASDEILVHAEGYTRSLERLCSEWVTPAGPAAASERARVWAELARTVAKSSSAEDAWYPLAGDLVERWCELVGEPCPSLASDLSEACFESWVFSDGQATRFGNSVALVLARDRFEARYGDLPEHGYPPSEWVAHVPEGEGAFEALIPHLLATLELDWSQPPSELESVLAGCVSRELLETGAQERHQVTVNGPAHGSEPAREARFLAGLECARQIASHPGPLGWDDLVEVQHHVLGGEASCRTTPALAKGGSEVYASFGFLEELLELKFSADFADEVHPVARAARLYLDLIYTHPFADGNARAARLGLELVLRRAGLPTPELQPLERFSKPAGDPQAYWGFVAAIAAGVAQALA